MPQAGIILVECQSIHRKYAEEFIDILEIELVSQSCAVYAFPTKAKNLFLFLVKASGFLDLHCD